MNVGNLFANLSLDFSPFMVGLQKAQAAVSAAAAQMQNDFNRFENSVNKVNDVTKKTKIEMKDLQRIVSGILISQAFYAGLNAIKDATAAVVNFSNQMQMASIAMEYFLGSKEDAQAFVEVMKDFAATTPFTTEQALNMSRRLMAMGFAADSVKSVLTIMTDAASATGGTAEQMDRVVLALGQMKTNGYIAGQELRQLAEAGIPVYKILQEELGLTVDQLKDIGQLKISGDLGVQAVLTGLEKRYKGAAARIADTLPGMWSTIKDDFLIVADGMFKAPYNALTKFVGSVRDAFEDARNVIRNSGVGGWFEHVFPPELQTSIRSILAGFRSIGQSMSLIFQTVAPMFKMAIDTVVRALGIIVPIIANVIKAIAQFAYYAINASPAVRMLAQVIIGLVVANVAAKALMFLWGVVRLGTICTWVAQSVTLLAKAVQALMLVFTKQPIVAIISIAAAALMAFALSSKTVSDWLDVLMSKLGALAGINVDGILNPEDNKQLKDYTDKFNKSLTDTTKNLKNVGADAEKSGKKVKDKFVASFDELYQIPDNLDDVNDSLSDIGSDLPDLPDISMPSLDITPPHVGGSSSDNPFKDVFPFPAKGGGPSDGSMGEPPQIPPPDLSPALSAIEDAMQAIRNALQPAWETVNVFVTNTGLAFDGLGAKVRDWGTQAQLAITGWKTQTELAFADWNINAQVVVSGFKIATEVLLDAWVTNTVGKLAEWKTSAETTLTTWKMGAEILFSVVSANVLSTLSGWKNNALQTIGEYATSAETTLATWKMGAEILFSVVSANISTTMTTWKTNVVTTLEEWRASAEEKFSTWQLNVETTVDTWSANIQTAFGNWKLNTETAISNWKISVESKFNTWSSNVQDTVSTWNTNISTTFESWRTTVSNTLTTWKTNAEETFSTWYTNTANNVWDWITGTSDGFNSWVSTVATYFADWANNVMSNVAVGMNNMGESVASGLTNMGYNINTWVGQSSKALAEWGSNITSNIGTTMQNFVSTIGSALSHAWSSLLSFKQAAGEKITSWWEGNKQWVVPVGLATVALGLGAAAAFTGGATAAPAYAAGVAALAAVPAMNMKKVPTNQLATGGIVDQDQLIRISEGNKREAVIPLENSSYMKPFSQAVASDLADMIYSGPSSQYSSGRDDRQILYVGTLIADDRSLKELERKLKVIRISETQREGG